MDWPQSRYALNRVYIDCVVQGGTVLCADGELRVADVIISKGVIVEVSPKANTFGCHVVNASHCLVLPGIVDIHGDAFERNIMPRPGTMFPLDMAMLDTDRQLVANGITTACHGVSISWEPGLRNLAEAKRIISVLEKLELGLMCDNRVHIRWETFALEEASGVVELFGYRKKPILAFNDHTSQVLNGERPSSKLRTAAARAMIDQSTYAQLLGERKERAGEVQSAIEALAAIAKASDIAMLSHDDATVAVRHSYRNLGALIAEFPLTWEVADDAGAHDEHIVLGAPNVVRGGSHTGAISAVEAIVKGRCTILASDYYYPAPMHAAFQLAASGVLPLPLAWNLVSLAPARAIGLEDRGALAPGKRADIVIVPQTSQRALITLVCGKIVYQSA